jgi:hypothetical protein
MLPYQQRVVEEKAALDDKLVKLNAFLFTEPFNSLEREDKILLVEQFGHMQAYSVALAKRVARFGGYIE